MGHFIRDFVHVGLPGDGDFHGEMMPLIRPLESVPLDVYLTFDSLGFQRKETR